MKLNKLIALGLSAIMALSLVACGNANAGNPNVQPPSPFTDHETLADAAKEVGFEISVPSIINGFDECMYRANKESDMLEVIFRNDDEDICFRKAVGDGDISGDYNKFSEQNEVEVNGATVTMKGNDGKVNLATWAKNGYAYSISCTTAVDKVTMTDYIKTVYTVEPDAIGGDPATWGPAGDDVQIPSPFIDCDSMDAAAELAGFDMTLPRTADFLQVIEGRMIQAFYGEDGNDMFIRKATGTGDISGDYNVYAQTETVDSVTLKGENDTFSLAIWEKDGYTYSVSVGEALGQTDMLALVAAVQ